jgi:hypothetical protein
MLLASMQQRMADRDRSWTYELRTARAWAAAVSVGDGRAGLRRPDHLLRSNKKRDESPDLHNLTKAAMLHAVLTLDLHASLDPKLTLPVPV